MMMKALKFAPSLIVVSVCGAVLWPYFNKQTGASVAPPSSASAGMKTPARPLTAQTRPDRLRDPFRPSSEQPNAATLATNTRVEKTRVDPIQQQLEDIAETVKGMTLGGTYLNGKKRLAIIDGKVYSRGESVGEAEPDSPALIIKEVFAEKVVLNAMGKDFTVGYPDKLEAVDPADDGGGNAGDANAALQALLGGQAPVELGMLQNLLNSQGSGVSGLLAPLLLDQLGRVDPNGVAAGARPGSRGKARAAGGAAPAGGDPALYAAADAGKASKGTKAKATAGPAGGDPALYGGAAKSGSGGSKSGSKAKKSAPSGGDPALYGGDTKKKGGRSKR